MLVIFLVPFVCYLFYSLVSRMFFLLIGVIIFLYFLFHVICFLIFDCDIALGFADKFGKSIDSLKGKVVFITGASSGIGEHTAKSLAKNGVKLVLAARRKEELERVKSECLGLSKGLLSPEDILTMQVDVLRIDLHQFYFDEALRHFGQIDIFVNNAGRSQRAHWEEIDLNVDKQLFDLNVFAVVSFSRIATKYFLKRNVGHLAVTSSLAGIIGAPFSGSYTGSKHAIHGYFNSLRIEKMLNNLTVSIICPGPTFSNFLAESFTDKPGQKYGIGVTSTDKRMTGERCGHLCAVALANKTEECWMGLFPLMPLVYGAVYWPNLYHIALKIIGPQRLYKLRDSKDEMEPPN